MSEALRVAGRTMLGDGGRLTWSVAEGARGRRWRETVDRDGGLVRALLLEVATSGRPTRLEMTTAAGMLTLHPEPGGRELHGNVVTSSGMRHLRYLWSPEHELLVLGSVGCASATLGRLAEMLSVDETLTVPMLRVDDALQPRAVVWQVTRTADATWAMASAARDEERAFTVDEDGLVVLPDEERWPLELR